MVCELRPHTKQIADWWSYSQILAFPPARLLVPLLGAVLLWLMCWTTQVVRAHTKERSGCWWLITQLRTCVIIPPSRLLHKLWTSPSLHSSVFTLSYQQLTLRTVASGGNISPVFVFVTAVLDAALMVHSRTNGKSLFQTSDWLEI